MEQRDKLIAYALRYGGNYKDIYRAVKKDEAVDITIGDIKALTILDAEYPKVFFDLALPPLVLFYKGDIKLLEDEGVAVVGSRAICDYAKRATCDLVCKLKEEYTIISGLAKGVDRQAHLSALDRKTIGIIGCGIDYVYPKENDDLFKAMAKNQLILSEYPLKTAPYAKNFPFRNRLIAALAKKVYVMQAGVRSGTFITVNEALELGKEVYALPYDIYDVKNSGCNLLIKEGAMPIGSEDIYM